MVYERDLDRSGHDGEDKSIDLVWPAPRKVLIPMQHDPPRGGKPSKNVVESLSARIALSTLALVLITTLAKTLGFVEKLVIAYYFGADLRVDAFFVACSVPFLFFLLIRELIEPAFLPLFMENLRAGEERRAWRLFGTLAAGITILTLGYGAYVWFRAPALLTSLAPGFGPEAVGHGARLLRIMIPSVLFLGLSALTYITLNAYGRFALPSTGDLALKIGPSLLLALFFHDFGIAALALGFTLGAAARLGTHLAGLAPKLRWIGIVERSARRDLLQLGVLMAPLAAGSLFSMVSELADNYFSSQIGEGGVSARMYAKKIRDLPIELIPYTLSVVLFPAFARLAAERDRGRLARLFARSVHGLAIWFAPIAVGFVLLAEPLVSLALERGEFNAADRSRTAWPLRWYGLGMVTFAIETVLVNLWFSLRKTLTPIAVGVACVGLDIGLSFVLSGRMGVGGVALSSTISKTVKVCVLAVLLSRQGAFVSWRRVADAAWPIGAGAAIMSIGLWIIVAQVPFPSGHTSVLTKAAYLGGAGLAGCLLYFGTVAAIGPCERQLVWSVPSALARTALSRIRGYWRCV